MEIRRYEAILRQEIDEKRTLNILLGNGFSLAFDKKCFAYESLADWANRAGYLAKETWSLFERLNTKSFELSMQFLEKMEWASKNLLGITSRCIETELYRNEIRSALIESIKANHPHDSSVLSAQRRKRCEKFLEPFQNIFSLNYDLLLYWLQMGASGRLNKNDGFSWINSLEGTKFTGNFQTGRGKIFYLHGALHIFSDNSGTYKLSARDKCLTSNVSEMMERGHLPTIVVEGSSASKLSRIDSVPYLRFCLEALQSCHGSLVTFGASLSIDTHILDSVARNPNLDKVFIGFYGSSYGMQELKNYVEKKRQLYGIKNFSEFAFFDTSDILIWG